MGTFNNNWLTTSSRQKLNFVRVKSVQVSKVADLVRQHARISGSLLEDSEKKEEKQKKFLGTKMLFRISKIAKLIALTQWYWNTIKPIELILLGSYDESMLVVSMPVLRRSPKNRSIV